MDLKKKIPEDLLDLNVSYTLSPFYKYRLNTLILENNLDKTQALEFLLDIYTVDNSRHFKVISRQLLKRMRQGVDRSFIIQLRTLYTIVGHFLKRLRYI